MIICSMSTGQHSKPVKYNNEVKKFIIGNNTGTLRHSLSVWCLGYLCATTEPGWLYLGFPQSFEGAWPGAASWVWTH